MKYTYTLLALLMLASCGTTGDKNLLQSRAEQQQPVDVRLVEPIRITINTDTQYVYVESPCDTVFVEVPTQGSGNPTEPSTPTSGTQPTQGAYRDHLGVVITPASDKLITGVPDDVSEAFKHVRYMGNGYSLRDWQPPSSGVRPNECVSDNLSTIWNECQSPGMQSSMVRLNKLCTQFPDATITFVNEYFVGFGWPRKTLTKQELLGEEGFRFIDFGWTDKPLPYMTAPDSLTEAWMIDQMFTANDVGFFYNTPRSSNRQARRLVRYRDLTQQDKDDIYDIYFQEYAITLNSLSILPNQIIFEVMNENWGRDYIEVANIQYQAAMDAHRIHAASGGNVILSSGPRQWTNRDISWAGGLLAESILEVPTFFLEYLNETGGVVSMNLYPDDPNEDTESGFVLYENWERSPEWFEVGKLSEHLSNEYPEITLNISETGFTSSPKEQMPTQSQRVSDREYVIKLIDKCLDADVDIIYMYQIEEHSGLNEGKFVGTAVSDDIDWWIEFSQNKISN